MAVHAFTIGGALGSSPCFVQEGLTLRDGQAMGVLESPLRRKLYSVMRSAEVVRVSDLAKQVHLNPSSIRWHLAKMRRAGLISEREGDGQRYRIADTPEARQATAILLLTSLPARELMAQVERTPGHHLQELADNLRAPRSRYWRVAKSLEQAGLVRVRPRHKAKLLFPTVRGLQALEAVRAARIDPRGRTRRTVREFPSLILRPKRRR